ncbi:MAG: polyprenyl synthetase family protein [Verrucomicrobium sp.]|jgi:octaprenyl-diphosphate synthase|nr:polyprenyl synthetase family protein [Verrucomicrobium sp.]
MSAVLETQPGIPEALSVADWEPVIAPAREFLARVSETLEAQVDEFDSEIAEYARYALENQGKQLRPTLVALSGGAVGPLTDDSVAVAVIIEMIHLATLVHDDIMDEASMRRRRATLAAKWGNQVAVLLGDCLFAHALKLSADLPSAEVSRLVASASGRVCAGEILQSHRRRRWSVDRPDYFKVIEMKTGELFALACDLGARLSGGSPSEVSALRRYGMSLGTAYQIYDDCLDLYGVESAAGKSLGTDLASGKVTLPLIVGLDHASADERQRLIGWLEDWQPEFFPRVRDLLEGHRALERSREVITGFLNDADRALSQLKPGPQVEALSALNRFLARQTDLLAGS